MKNKLVKIKEVSWYYQISIILSIISIMFLIFEIMGMQLMGLPFLNNSMIIVLLQIGDIEISHKYNSEKIVKKNSWNFFCFTQFFLGFLLVTINVF